MSDPLPPQPAGDERTADAPPPARPYTAVAPDAPQYALPAYAIPTYAIPASATAPTAGAASSRPATPPPGHAYVTPTAYALPPYARHPVAAPPAYPGSPSFATPPGGVPPVGAVPGGALPGGAGPGGIDTRPKALAIIALVVAGAGVLTAIVAAAAGSWTSGALSPLLLSVAFVLSLIALISRRQGGKGFGFAALGISIVGGVLAVVLAVAAIVGSFAGSSDVGAGPYEDDYEEYVVPGITAPGTDGQPDSGAQFAAPVQPTVAETAFGKDYDDVWWYAVVIDNPNPDYVFDSYVEVIAYAEDGSTLGSAPGYAMLLSGRTAVVGYFFDMGDAQIASVDVDLPAASEATLSPADETGSFAVEQVTGPVGSGGPAEVSGTVSAHFADDQEYVAVAVLARAADGTIAAATTTYVDAVPGDGTPVSFDAWFDELPPDAALEAFAHR
ncbi:hypothetical protein GCM10025760_14500 [Microbacterium yannicii]|uniref:DUF4190 domain-containing protein n=1 Tax=Microbacterium yannicii TaxID=671622 RepID=A0ABP9M736_9MICO|nr:hypothetical protein [Microbacterium yannicii]MCO5954885.1 hypothetical protein [Microbacterium yannicii]